MTSSIPSSPEVSVPAWVIELHQRRKELFLRFVEPIIQFALGPLEHEHEHEHQPFQYVYTHHYQSNAYNDYYSHPYESPNTRRKLGFLPNYVEDVSVFRETSMSFATLVTLTSIMTCISLVFLSCFYHNQKTSPLFISPRRNRLPKLVPPPLPVDGTFSWINVCFYLSDEEIINRVGFDSLIFLRFHRLALRCIVKMSLFSFFVLLPINFTGGGHANASDLKGYVGSLLFTDFLRFTMANVMAGSPRLWVHCIAAYLLSLIVMRELVVEYNAFNNIRHRYMLSKEPHLRTVLVSNIPRHLRSPKKITNYFKHVYPDAVKHVTMCQNLIQLEKLIAKRTIVLTKIEQELLLLCQYEKGKILEQSSKFYKLKNTVRRFPLNCLEKLLIVDHAQERLSYLYSQLENLNMEIYHEQRRRYRVMKKLDKMEASGQGRKDIDYILATPFIDQEALNYIQSNSLPPTTIYPSLTDASLPKATNGSTTISGLPNNQGERLNSDAFNYVQLKDSFVDNPSYHQSKLRPFAKAKQAIKRYTRSVLFPIKKEDDDYDNIQKLDPLHNNNNDKTSSDGTKVNKYSKKDDHIENHANEVTDKAFVQMKTFTASSIAIQSMHSSKPGAMEIITSPEPRDVLWENVYVAKGARKTREFVGQTLVILIIAFYVVPVALVSLLVSESALISISPRLAQLDQASALFSSGIALVQPVCLVLIQQLLPPLFMAISKAEGLISFSQVQMKAFSRYFMFQILNVFLVTSIAGSIFDTLAIILENPEAAFEMLGNSLPRMSSFFITLVTMKTFLGLGVELVRTMSIVQSVLRYILFPTATLRQKKLVRIGMRAIDDPGWFPFHKILAQDMLVVVISVVFAVVAPIVLLPCALFCLFSRIMWTHHHLYVYESVFESGGQFWPKIFRRFVFGLIIAQMTITGQFILKEARHEAYATILLMIMTYYFLRSTRARYDPPSSTLPLEVATIMDITVAQEEEARRREFESQQQKQSSTDQNVVSEMKEPDANANPVVKNVNDFLLMEDCIDPFDDAYVQPAIRANARARPEQPFPPAQLGREEILAQDPSLINSVLHTQGLDSKGTVKLKALHQKDRKAINLWWKQRMDLCGKQNFLSVLIGEESGKLRLGKRRNNHNGATK